MLDTKERISVERITEPPKRWRNWWRATRFCFADDLSTGNVIELNRGEKVPGGQVWPSKEVAEANAMKAFVESARRNLEPLEYLGAFPDGVTP